MAPHRRAPDVPARVRRANGRLIDLDAQSRTSESLDVAVHELQWCLVKDVVQHLGTLVVVNPDALFLDQEVGGGEAHLQTRGELSLIHISEPTRRTPISY